MAKNAVQLFEECQLLFDSIVDQFTRQDILGEWAQAVESSILRNFVVGGRYSRIGSWLGGSKKWQDLASSTVRARKRKGYYPINILRQKGLLIGSVSVSPTSSGLIMKAGRVYASVHQYGSERQSIPARPFLVIQREDIEELRDIILDHLRK